jgi:DNA repair exonuclease SbcCD ATPase subunit
MKEKNNMKIVYVKLINFEAISKAMGLKEFTFSFDKIDKPIIQIYGKNHCGKTVLMQLLHPFSSINLNGDERSDLALIIPGEVGIKNIVYEINGEVYSITHTYKPAQNGHLISSSLIHDGVELNTSNGVTVFNSLIEKIFCINKYVFQFIINGTQLLSFAMMSSTQRKALMNKAMGIDIYDKIHKMSTDDYRYTSKLISSLNNTKEYLLSTYGSFETLVALLNHKRKEKAALQLSIDTSKSRLDSLTGTISTIKRQNVIQELTDVSNTIIAYKNVVNIIGEFDDNMYEKLIDQQISLNNEISDLRNKKIIISKDLDILYSKKRDIENTMLQNQKNGK